ncbi:MAG: ABC transporter ATP-binding protein [Bacillota bacterium]|jgi:ABC-2 type transport system ATP-binding protein|nr:ABC transporter ATP-binding protein [Bacillota bacterium]HOB43219.1 ABC transporter ATP-binding protein [Bacillota bacterium]HOK69831.1 ABC transporter ATP-binding protein [Bacillota bacterium]HOL52626.1 ABC transporter ATP-binding protein [Bacillota bacterium]HOO30876.1 ABC transporter ATP-binding protein [Bacillota bacterium]
MINALGLTKRFGDTLAVDSLDLHVGAGEIFGFLGPNGAGKTTSINMMIGILTPTAGRVELAGIDVAKDPLKAKAIIGYVPDQPNIYEKLTAWEFLMFVANLHEVERGRAEKKARNLLKMFDLLDRADEQLGGYSHGMKQKVVIASALLHEPKILFMDEPTVGLDPGSARLVKDILRELASEGVTVFMSTHVLEIAERMCDRVGIIQKGRLLAVGNMDDLREVAAAKGAMKHPEASTLEDLFIELTGGSDYAEVSRYLEG